MIFAWFFPVTHHRDSSKAGYRCELFVNCMLGEEHGGRERTVQPS